MDCPKCGYERQSGDTHCDMCGLDFGLWERQVEEKKKLKALDQESGTPVADLKLEGPAEPPPSTDASPSGLHGECPKCQFPRRANDLECPNCGVIYSKHEQLIAKQKAQEEAKRLEEEKRFAEERARIQREAEKAIAAERAKREKTEQPETGDAAEPEAAQPLAAAKKKSAADAFQPLLLKFKSLFSNPKRLLAIVISLVAICAVGYGGMFFYQKWQKDVERRRILAEEAAAKQAQAEKYQRIADEFNSREEEIVEHLRSLIEKRQFDLFKQEIAPYDIPPLQEKLAPVKKYRDEITLFDSAKWIPAAEYGKNYEVYFQLHQMAPENTLYKSKMQHYRKLYAERKYRTAKAFLKKKKRYRSELQTALSDVEKAIELEGLKKKYRKLRHELQKAELLFFEGNDQVQMAVRDDGITKGATGGQRKIYVWIKNVGDINFFVNVDYFSLVTESGKAYSYNNCSRELLVDLKPGEQTQGYIYFYTPEAPAKLVFAHINAGKISRKFPVW